MKAHPLFPYFLEKHLAIPTSPFFHLLVNVFSVIIIANYHNQLLQTVFLEYTEAMATSLIPLYIILPEICAFIIGFSCTVWTKISLLAGSLVDNVLVDAILIPPCPPIPSTNIRMVWGP